MRVQTYTNAIEQDVFKGDVKLGIVDGDKVPMVGNVLRVSTSDYDECPNVYLVDEDKAEWKMMPGRAPVDPENWKEQLDMMNKAVLDALHAMQQLCVYRIATHST